MSRTQQTWLLQYQNPLLTKLGEPFFKSIPRQPGVYFMKGADGGILYVGKSVNLRSRLRSYTRANPTNSSRKILRLVSMLQSIEWKTFASEKEALLQENKFLRKYRPLFNRVNTQPESYLFLGTQFSESGVSFVLRNAGESFAVSSDQKWHGAFKARGQARRGYGALLRLLWLAFDFDGNIERFLQYPSSLLRVRLPRSYRIQYHQGVNASEREILEKKTLRFLKGFSPKLVPFLSERLLELDFLPEYLYPSVQEDLRELESFYETCSKRTRKIARFRDRLTPEEKGMPLDGSEIDDLLVVMRHGGDN